MRGVDEGFGLVIAESRKTTCGDAGEFESGISKEEHVCEGFSLKRKELLARWMAKTLLFPIVVCTLIRVVLRRSLNAVRRTESSGVHVNGGTYPYIAYIVVKMLRILKELIFV